MKLSVIMPCYNVEDTLARAIDSVLMQDLDEEYEILIVDDASTDRTGSVALEYAEKYPQVKYFLNEQNSGNAHSFYRGLSESQGEYFCVLDGDDYYTIPNKLKKQVTFLDEDGKGEYVATATHFVIDFGDGTVHVPDRSKVKEFTYSDLLLSRAGYYHTATYMYRNIFRGNVPEYFDMAIYRGDSPRTIFHLMFSGKKVRVLDFVGSAYTYTLKGIWSSRNEKDHFQYQVNFYQEHRRFVQTELERSSAERLIQRNRKGLANAGSDMHHYPTIGMERCLKEVKGIANKFAFSKKDYVLREAYASEYLDTLLASLGAIMRTNFDDFVQKTANEDTVCIFVSALNPQGGGIFAEVVELASMYADKNVYVFQTDEGGISDEAYEALEGFEHVHALTYPLDCESPFAWLSKKMVELSPYRAYYYCSHADVHSQALMAQGPCENICLFSFDHGFVTGLHNPNLNTIAAKRPVDYLLLSREFPEKLCYLPAWSRGANLEEGARYRPFEGHERIVTASGAARFYKIDGVEPYRYLDAIVLLLKEAGGVHYHFGPIPPEVLDSLRQTLRDEGVPEDRFVHVAWSSNIPADLIKNHVDLFIEPFPTVSYKLTLNVLSAGVPVIAWRGIKRMSVTDFVPADSLFWRTKEELVDQIKTLDRAKLEALSESASAYFAEFHAFDIVRSYVRSNTSMPVGPIPKYADDSIHDIIDYLPVFDMTGISVMRRYLEEQRREQAKEKDRKLAEKAREIEKKRRAEQRKAAIAYCDRVKSSRSFAVGYALSSGARALKHAAKRSDNATPVDKLHQMSSEEFVDAYGSDIAVKKVDSIKSSHTFRFGYMITSPGRKAKKIAKKLRR